MTFDDVKKFVSNRKTLIITGVIVLIVVVVVVVYFLTKKKGGNDPAYKWKISSEWKSTDKETSGGTGSVDSVCKFAGDDGVGKTFTRSVTCVDKDGKTVSNSLCTSTKPSGGSVKCPSTQPSTEYNWSVGGWTVVNPVQSTVNNNSVKSTYDADPNARIFCGDNTNSNCSSRVERKVACLSGTDIVADSNCSPPKPDRDSICPTCEGSIVFGDIVVLRFMNFTAPYLTSTSDTVISCSAEKENENVRFRISTTDPNNRRFGDLIRSNDIITLETYSATGWVPITIESNTQSCKVDNKIPTGLVKKNKTGVIPTFSLEILNGKNNVINGGTILLKIKTGDNTYSRVFCGESTCTPKNMMFYDPNPPNNAGQITIVRSIFGNPPFVGNGFKKQSADPVLGDGWYNTNCCGYDKLYTACSAKDDSSKPTRWCFKQGSESGYIDQLKKEGIDTAKCRFPSVPPSTGTC